MLPPRRRSSSDGRTGAAGCARAARAMPWELPLRLREVHPMWQLRHLYATCVFTPDHACWHTCQNRAFEQTRKGRGRVPAWARLPNRHAALQQGLEKSFTVHVPRIKQKYIYIYAVQLLTCIALKCLAESVKGHLAPKNKREAKSPHISWSLSAFIPVLEGKQPKMGNIISLKTSFLLLAVGDRQLC